MLSPTVQKRRASEKLTKKYEKEQKKLLQKKEKRMAKAAKTIATIATIKIAMEYHFLPFLFKRMISNGRVKMPKAMMPIPKRMV